MFNCWEIFLLTFMLLQDFSQSLRLVEVRIPNYVIKGSAAQLECLYDLDGEVLYSVKWYKDGNEFYRYVPRDMPPVQTFLLPGVSVDANNSTDSLVLLREVNLQSGGRFRCEVSGEAPSFQTVTEHGDMVVVSLPDQGPPKISGGRPRYQIGDWVRTNCTAGRSKPAVQLSWYVNGEVAEPHTLRKYDTIISGREGLETSVLGLQFRVEQHHFRNGDMKLKCVASLSTFYWRSNEESVEGDRPQKAPVLESRETVYASNSRADPVQGMSLRESLVTKILSFFIQPNAANKTDSSVCIKPFTIVLLMAMALITTTGCLEEFYLNNLLQIVKKQSRKPYSNNVKSTDEDEHFAYTNDNNFKQHDLDKFKRIPYNKIMCHCNENTSSLPVMLRAASINKQLETQVTSVQQVNTTLETSVSCKTATKTSSSASLTLISTTSSPNSCSPALSAAQHKVVSLKSR